ncbi:MAG: tetratricopeptide repeat protein, partial [Anaerolineales bacterium]
MESFGAYIPLDRRKAIARGEDLPDRTSGAALFADISGFTPLTEALLQELGPRRGADELTRQLNAVYGALIDEVHSYGGSVLTFSGDAITCWFDGVPSTQQAGLRATACALAMQEVMGHFAEVQTPSGTRVSLAIKTALTTGPVRRFLVGDPQIQIMDVLAGTTLDRMAEAEKLAQKGEVVLGPDAIEVLGSQLEIAEWREEATTGQRFAVVGRLATPVETTSRSISTPLEQILGEEALRPWLLQPVYERLRTGQGSFLAELRPAVTLFLRFGGIDYDYDDAAGDKLNTYIQWVQGILARYESYLLQVTIGDKGSYLYAAFGAPLAHDDDAARAVAAALELRSLPVAIDYINRVQIGISQGRMRAGAYGGPTRRTYGVLGDEANVAARLMSRAEPGQIMISQRIAEAVTPSYRLEYAGPVKLKGKAEPLPVHLVLGRQRSAAQRPVNLFPTSLVGRNSELTQMEEILTASASGEGQILRMEGVAGIGKSHLVAEFAERALKQGWRVVLGACQSTGQDIPYHPWQQIFRALFVLVDEAAEGVGQTALVERQIEQVSAIVNEMNPAWLIRLPLLGDLLDLPIPDNPTTAAFDPQLRQETLFTLAVDLIQSWAQALPLLVLIEDAQWLDEASRGMTLALARVIARVPAMLTVVHRPPIDEGHPILPDLNRLPNYHYLDLGDLAPEGVAAIVTSRLQGQPSPLLLDLIQVQAKGNPFFVEELVDALREAGHLSRQADGDWALSEPIVTALREANCLTRDKAGQLVLNPDAPLAAADLGLPDSIHGLVLSRLDRMLEAHKLTLKVASVIGRVFAFELIAKSHPLQTDKEALLKQIQIIEAREFTRLEIPPPRLTHIFKHSITRDVTYETLLETQQRQLHQAVAEAMESLVPDAVEQLAYHYSRAKVWDKTLFYLDKAARKAQREYANETALNYYQQALALEERWEWRKGQVEVLHILGRREEERASLEELEANTSAPAFDVAYLWGQFHEATGDYPQAQAAIERALTASRAEMNALNEMRCLTQFGVIAHKRGEHSQAKAWYNQALALFEGQDSFSVEEAKAISTALNGLGVVHRQQGNFDEARANHERALNLSHQSTSRPGESQAFNDLGVMAFYQRHFDEAQRYHQQALEIRRTIGDRAGEGKSLHNLAIVTRDAGDYDQAQEYLFAALEILQATGNRWEEVNIWNDLGILYHELGDLPKARELLQQGLELSQEIGDVEGQAYIFSNLGPVARDGGDLETAERLLLDGLALWQKENNRYEISFFLSYLSTVSLQAGRYGEAIERAQRALAL